VIVQAREACETSSHAVSDHFVDIIKMIPRGKGAHRQVEDVRLSRYACYLIIQNADPEKPIVALGQTDFAMQARRQELSQGAATHRARARAPLPRRQMSAMRAATPDLPRHAHAL
jgi:DNA-damage-inducible protein D